MYAFFSSIGIWICLNLFHQFFEQFIFFHLLAGMMLNESTCEDLCINNFWYKFLGNRYWNMNLFTFFHHFIGLLSSRQFCSFSIYCDLAWYSIMETIIFSTWVVTSSVETCALTTFGANFWARGFVFSVHWATLLLIASGVSSKLFLKY